MIALGLWVIRFLDGAMQSRQVTHQNREFTRELADPVPRKSALAGTQKTDRDWRAATEMFLRSSPSKKQTQNSTQT